MIDNKILEEKSFIAMKGEDRTELTKQFFFDFIFLRFWQKASQTDLGMAKPYIVTYREFFSAFSIFPKG